MSILKVIALFALFIFVLVLCVYYESKRYPMNKTCPKCGGAVNYLTLSGDCQDCAWKEYEKRAEDKHN